MQKLLEEGADPDIKDDLYNATALGWAKHEGMESCISLFLEYGVVDK